MKIIHCENATELGRRAAAQAAGLLRGAIAAQGYARLLVSTGASQFTLFEALIREDVDWGKVTMFHLDEYIKMDETHPASFIGYLKKRFTGIVSLGAVHFVDGTGDIDAAIAALTTLIREKPIDVGLIGIGENGHIAFNDPPADFEDNSAYKVVQLDAKCRMQQFGEGWFPTLDDVPKEAISMTVKQILSCKHIISAVPYAVKAQAVYDTINAAEVTPQVPATALRQHDDVTLYLDADSASMLPK